MAKEEGTNNQLYDEMLQEAVPNFLLFKSFWNASVLLDGGVLKVFIPISPLDSEIEEEIPLFKNLVNPLFH